MKLQNIILPTLALGGAATLLLPGVTEAFSTIGGSLSSSGQRDVRLFNNFTNAGANDNTTPDASFPGYDGAERAVWKAVGEWGSTLHGTGNGDPHQPNGLGSGGANFDAAWAGNATSAGGTNDNIMSLGSGCSGGVLAFCETPISDGWRIIFCSQWTWADGPGVTVSGTDIQGVGCHEYGHALGLGHSTVGGTTMFPSISGTGVAQRSIEADDIAGVRAVYGIATATKPVITGLSVGVGTVTINGSNFDATNNVVWFTNLNSTAPGGFPMAASGPVSSNGTVITLNTPANAGPGDLLVKVPGTGHDRLSNAWPADISNVSCNPPTNFCVGAANSANPNGAHMSFMGSTSVSANDLVLVTNGLPPNKLYLHLYGEDQSAFLPFGNGIRCINSPFFRIYPAGHSDAFGDVFYPLDITSLPPGGPIVVGDSEGFQLWYRDPPAGGAGTNASDGLSTTWCP